MPSKRQNLPINAAPFPKRAHTEPILRWVGGKRWIVPLVSNLVYQRLQQSSGRYFEPFAGGAALALDLGLPGMVVSDLCEPLINLYQQAAKQPRVVHWMVERFKGRGTDEASYYKARDNWNDPRPKSDVDRAAWLFYLNALGYNGVYRENSKGGYNVPYGVRTKKDAKLPGSHPMVSHSFITLERLVAFANAVKGTEFVCADFAPIIERAGEGDFIFADSPYFGVFDKYLKEGFGVRQHVVLARALQAASARGVSFLATNNDTPEMRRLYRWAHIMETGEFRRVNRDATKRGKVDCLLIASSSDLLRHASPAADR